MNNSIEESFIDHISTSLPLFQKQSVAYRFQCPYCQFTGKASNGKPLAPSQAKGYLYPYGNAWNYKCHKCGIHQSLEKFLQEQFPLLHFSYVRLRDHLGTTGFQTNCPSLETLLKQTGLLGTQPPQFKPERFHQHRQHDGVPPALPGESATAATSASAAPKLTQLPPMRSPQQQAGHQSRLNHLIKQRQQQRRLREGW